MVINIKSYIKLNINIYPYIDKEIIKEVDGTLLFYNRYIERLNLINELKVKVYELTDISDENKKKYFDKEFNKFYKIVNDCKNFNKRKAESIIKEHLDELYIFFDNYIKNYNDIVDINFIDNLLSLYKEKQNDIEVILNTLDLQVKNIYVREINENYINLKNIKSDIEEADNDKNKLIKLLIKNYDISDTYYNKFEIFLQNINNNSDFVILENIDNIVLNIHEEIVNDIQNILDINNSNIVIDKKLYFFHTTKVQLLEWKKTYRCDIKIEDYITEKNIPEDFVSIIKGNINSLFDKLGLLNSTLNSNNFEYINIIKFKSFDKINYMTLNFYEYFFLDFINTFIDNNKFVILDNYSLGINNNILKNKINNENKLYYHNIIKDKFNLTLLEFLLYNNLQIS